MSEELLTKILEKLVRIEASMATKQELAEVKTELQADIGRVETELKTGIDRVETELKTDINRVKTELKADIAALDAKMEKGFADIVGMVNLLGEKTEAVLRIETKLSILAEQSLDHETDIRLLKKAR
ncbi:MAG TPA: hypothetical protein PKA28_05720 [Methylomusa anaerophila]|uniref:Uncharacterized protein n=1 Tax=Methylomusa anaerophila TaxID=1930071 RepID=A0A348ALV9_9FIRM|nr:hypothetical protein [Methylomusa anaerophila]BBB92057.1 hypothetical protein MAMMFC1_02742 [Methylomusa anaerophila]HML87931.1 hypothetical protein [Methylomusa anaerophila]